jgi:hypothetical protein
MKANPEKFQAIAIGKQTKQQNLTFTIDGNNPGAPLYKYLASY